MVFVYGNHVMLCGTRLREKTAERFMAELIGKAKIGKKANKFSLSKVADISKIDLIKSQGVKRIDLNACLFDASVEHSERNTFSKKLSGSFMDPVKAVFYKDAKFSDIDKAENLVAHISLTFNGRFKNSKLGSKKVEEIAEQMIEEGDDGFSIVTKDGQKINGDDIILKKSISMQKFGNSVFCTDAWTELEQYFYELKEDGLLEQ